MYKSYAAQIYRKLPGKDCGEGSPCGYPKCVDFAKALLKNEVELDECPYVQPRKSEEILMILAEYFEY